MFSKTNKKNSVTGIMLFTLVAALAFTVGQATASPKEHVFDIGWWDTNDSVPYVDTNTETTEGNSMSKMEKHSGSHTMKKGETMDKMNHQDSMDKMNKDHNKTKSMGQDTFSQLDNGKDELDFVYN